MVASTAGSMLQESLAVSDDAAVTGGLHRQMRHYGTNLRPRLWGAMRQGHTATTVAPKNSRSASPMSARARAPERIAPTAFTDV